MRTKGVLLLGLIVCWAAVCNGKGESMSSNEIEDTLSKELAQENLFMFGTGDTSKQEEECDCGPNGKCNEVGKDPKCTCDAGYAEKEGTCVDCECGSKGTCSFENGEKKCNCKEGTADKEGTCTETCINDSDCKNGGTCGEKKFCSCKSGLIGDKCQIVVDCTADGTYKGCEASGGECSYDGDKAVCTCSGSKKLDEKDMICKHCECGSKGTCSFENGEKKCNCKEGTADKEGTCTETCNDDSDCKNGGTCEPKGEKKFCSCKSGLIGDKCQIVVDCTADGTYKGCEASGGECSYDGDKAVCTCSGSKKLDEKDKICKLCDCGSNGTCSFENGEKKCNCKEGTADKDGTCTETCINDSDCKNGGTCGEKKFCSCKSGLIGDKCQIVVDCTADGTYKGCKASGGKCSYDGDKAVCICSGNKKLDEKDKICKLCDCGSNGTCSFENGEKKCICKEGTAEKEGTCTETCINDSDCKNGGTCETKGEKKFCSCKSGLIGDKCQIVFDCTADGTYKGCEASGGECSYDVDKAVCTCSGSKKLDEKDKICKPCDCGSNGICSFENGEKKCNCKEGTADKDGTCTETCNDDSDCKNGVKCEPKGEKKFCSCKSGLIGDKCQIVVDCTADGTYKGCEASGGKCSYDGDKAVCTCSGNKKLDEKDKICKLCNCGLKGNCRFVDGQKKCECNEGTADNNGKCKETCNEGECKHGSECVQSGNFKFCNCTKGLSGDKCETIDECVTGKFKDCKSEKGTCKYDEDEKKAVCNCIDGKKLDSELYYCLECVCGENEECSIKNKVTSCKCNEGFAKKEEKCLECNCGGKGTCSFVDGNKKCDCSQGYVEENGICKACDCGSSGKCDFKDGKKNCTCNLGYVVKETDEKCHKCDCGTGGTCHFEGDAAVCTCKQGFKEYQKKCKECDCGQHGDCKLDEKGDKKCECLESYAVKKVNGKDTCVETCEGDDDCKNQAKCLGPEGKRFCSCNPKLGGDKCEIVKDCVSGGKYSNCVDSGGECGFDGTDSTCTCHDPKKLDPRRNFCRTKCSSNDVCKHGAKCSTDFCQCLTGTEGDECEEVTLCKTLKCDEKDATCKYNSTKSPNTFCECNNENYIFVGDKCVEKCKPKDYCQNGGTCNTQTNLCKCKPNTSGDKCEKILGCEPLKCKDINAECVYDQQAEKPTCKCENNYYYEKGECKPEWCRTGCKTAISTCLYEDGVGICKCKTAGNYYDYTSKTCRKIDLCFNKTCEDDLICSSGKCQCPDNHKQNGTRCEQMDLCKDKSLCFPDAKCEAGSSFGYVKCTCNSASAFYNPKTGKCSDGSCFLPDHRKDCKKPCPQGMTFKDGNCKHDVDTRKCDNDCGFLGWCYNVSKTEQKCVCLSSYAAIDQKTKKCVLKASEVCPTTEKDGDNKCKCTGKYKQATNGITCELKSCSDEDVQKECKSKGAIKCVENWKKDGGYKCVCPDGYVDDSKKGCIDPCSQDKAKDECSSNGQVCYIGDRDRVGDCRCPPTFTYNEIKKSCDLIGDNTFLIHGLPVLSKKYETPENNINKVVLNRDVAASMKQAFANLDFVHVFSFKVDKEVLLCDVWLQFKSDLPPTFNATLEVRRWQALTVEVQNEFLLPPQLLLSSSHISATSEELTLCTDSVRRSVCGSGSICESNKCKCGAGFREIDSTIKAFGDKRIVRCEDIDECTEAKHNCKENTTRCVNTLGDYFCVCKSGFKKAKGDADALNKEECIGLCDPNPCNKGSCKLTAENNVDCTCTAGYSGSYCNRADVNLAKAGKSTKVVGAVLGTLLAIVIILIIVYIVRQRKNSYSEDFTPAPRVDNAEMIERRPMRGVTNRAYQ